MIFECKNPDGTGVYKIENVINGNCYIGCTTNFLKRFNQHNYCLLKNYHFSKKMQNDFNEYNADDFIFSIIKELEFKNNKIEYQELLRLESRYIFNIQPFYNTTGKDNLVTPTNNTIIFKKAITKNILPSGYVNLIRLEDGTVKKLGRNSSYNKILQTT